MKFATRALGRLPTGAMNRTEAAYAAFLDTLIACKDVLWWKFEAVNLRLAEKTFYRPDFLVLKADGALECHEVKGHWEEDARVKIKVAASIYPMQFIAVQALHKSKGSGWKVERF